MFDRKQLRLYFICGSQDIPEGQDIHDVLQTALKAGITMFQFREKGPHSKQGEAKVELARSLFNLCQKFNVPFIVNDDVELAQRINADGIHVGQEDKAVAEFAEAFHEKIIGLSVGNITEYQNSDLSQVDYIGVGPMYATRSKSDAAEPVGTEMISQLRTYIKDFPIVGIGGINISNSKRVFDGGADGVSVISAIAQSDNITQTVQKFLQTSED